MALRFLAAGAAGRKAITLPAISTRRRVSSAGRPPPFPGAWAGWWLGWAADASVAAGGPAHIPTLPTPLICRCPCVRGSRGPGAGVGPRRSWRWRLVGLAGQLVAVAVLELLRIGTTQPIKGAHPSQGPAQIATLAFVGVPMPSRARGSSRDRMSGRLAPAGRPPRGRSGRRGWRDGDRGSDSATRP